MRSITQSLYQESLPSQEDVNAALESMSTLNSKEDEFVQVSNIETLIVILSCLSNLKFLV